MEKAAWAVYHVVTEIPLDVGSPRNWMYPTGHRSTLSSGIRPNSLHKANQWSRGNRNNQMLMPLGAGVKRVFTKVLKELIKEKKKKDDDHNPSHTLSLRRCPKRAQEPRLQ